jgi:hypothetical protein
MYLFFETEMLKAPCQISLYAPMVPVKTLSRPQDSEDFIQYIFHVILLIASG